MWIFIVGWKSLFWWFQANLACWCWDSMWKKVYKRLNPWINLMKLRPSDHCGWRSLQNSSQQELSSFKLLEIYFYPGPPGRAGENIFSICVSLIGILRVGIAKHHAVEVVSKYQPLKLNSERALTPAVHWHIRLADTVCLMSYDISYVLWLMSYLMSHDLCLTSHLMSDVICSYGFGLCLAFTT